MSACRPTVAEIDLGAVAANLRELKRHVRGKAIWAVIKADAYGHGAVPVARTLAREAVTGFCVATASEGRELRRGGIALPILVTGGLWPGGAEDAFAIAVEYGLAVAIEEIATAERLAREAVRQRVGPASVHLKVDTGMGRLGVGPEGLLPLARFVDGQRALALDGMLSSLATAESLEPEDVAGAERVREQARRFQAARAALAAEGLLPEHRTLANSAAALHQPESWEPDGYTGVRPGLALFGVEPVPGRSPVPLRPALRWVCDIVAVHEMPAGCPVGYGLHAVTRRRSRIGVLPVGYHDGLPRAVGDRGHVLVRGRRVPFIGRISMDLALVDLTDVSAARAGDVAVLLGAAREGTGEEAPRSAFAEAVSAALAAADGDDRAAAPAAQERRDAIGADELAGWSGSIAHEILSRIGPRVPRRYVGEPGPAATRGGR